MAASYVASYGPGAVVGASAATPTSNASITCAAGDLLLVGVATCNGKVVPASVSGGGLTWTKVGEANSGSVSGNSCMTWFAASAPGAQTFTATVTVTDTSPDIHAWTWTCQRWSGAALSGGAWQQSGSSTGQISFTSSVAGGALVMGISDWNAVDGPRTYVTADAGAYTETLDVFQSGALAAYLGYYANDGAAGSKTVGTSAPAGALDAIAVVELSSVIPGTYLPKDLPVLVGRQYVQKLRTTKAVSLPSPTAVASDIRQGPHLRPAATLTSPTMSTALVKMISPNWHINPAVSVTAPFADETHVVGYTTGAQAVLRPPHQARAKSHREFTILETPAQTHEFRFESDSLMWGYTLDAMSLARIYGQWEARYVQVEEEIPGLDRCFRGGHRHYITPDDAAELTAAGFGDYIRTEVLK